MSESKTHLFDRVQQALDSIVDEYNYQDESMIALSQEFKDYRGLMKKELEESNRLLNALGNAAKAWRDQSEFNSYEQRLDIHRMLLDALKNWEASTTGLEVNT